MPASHDGDDDDDDDNDDDDASNFSDGDQQHAPRS